MRRMAPPEPPSRRCDACAEALKAGGLYFRFAIALQGEMDVLDAPSGDSLGTDPHAILAHMEAEADWERYETDVHWEREGVLCPACRRRLCDLIEPGSVDEEPEPGGPTRH